MNVKEFISSGILELYVAGTLSEKENLEIHGFAIEYPEIHKEIREIEATILELAKIASPVIYQPDKSLDAIMDRIEGPQNESEKQFPVSNTNLKMYLGWAASLILFIGLAWLYNQNTTLTSKVSVVNQENEILERALLQSKTTLKESQEILMQLRDKNITSVTALTGQEVSPTSFAKVYWNKEEKKVYIDALGLPEPPDGMVYQIWSLTNLSPLTPLSIGILDDFEAVDNKVFVFQNKGLPSVAFGITLEPIGGSETPTMEQLYTLGVVAS